MRRGRWKHAPGGLWAAHRADRRVAPLARGLDGETRVLLSPAGEGKLGKRRDGDEGGNLGPHRLRFRLRVVTWGVAVAEREEGRKRYKKMWR